MDFSINEFGLLDSEESSRGYVTARIVASSIENATVKLMMFGKDTGKEILLLDDYPYSNNKKTLVDDAEELLKYMDAQR